MLPELKMARQVSFDNVTLVVNLELIFQWNGRKHSLAVAEPGDGCKVDTQPPTRPTAADYLASVSVAIPNHSPSSSFSSSPNSPPQLSPYYSNEYFAVRPSLKGGLGAFATRDIPDGTIIIAEKPLFKVRNWEDVAWEHAALSREKRRAYAKLHHWVGIVKDNVHGIYLTNRFEIGSQGGIFLNCSRFNHACHPYTTCTYAWDVNQKRLVVSTVKDTLAGEELTISYMGWQVDQKILKKNYGFECDCPGCLAAKEAKKEAKKETVAAAAARRVRPRHQVFV